MMNYHIEEISNAIKEVLSELMSDPEIIELVEKAQTVEPINFAEVIEKAISGIT